MKDARLGVISGLLLVLPLVLGARGCERGQDGNECDGGECGPGGQGGSAAAGTSGGGDSAGRGGDSGGGGCLHAGERHDVGDTFPSDDGCNTCTCERGGTVACTLRACTNVCGGLTGLPCPRGQYCNYPQDAQCGAADQTGSCEVPPNACTQQYEPVCGCDDRTYGNACEAAANGVSVLHDGECDPGSGGGGGDDGNAGAGGSAGVGGSAGDDGSSGSGGRPGSGSGQTCGGIASLECADPDEFCNYEPSAGGQGCDGTISDAGGVCLERPQACTREYDPVCGCDRRTYGNDCTAHADSVSVLHGGACTEIDCAEIGGHAVDGIGPGPMCPTGEIDHGAIVYSNGMIAIEGTICCVPQ